MIMVYLESERCYIRTFNENDTVALANLVSNNKRFWSIHEPLHSAEYYTVKFQQKRIQESMRQMAMSREYSFGVFLKGTNYLVGHISIYSIKRMPFSSAFVGYSLDEQHTGQGLATEILANVTKFAFEDLSLHRVEAYVSPANGASYRVLEKAGYEREGLLKQLLYINGKWVDHYLYSIIDKSY